MKSHFSLLLPCLLMAHSAIAQSGFEAGKAVIQPGIGYGLINTYGDMTTPPISVTVDVAASKEYSIGGYIGYAASHEVQFPRGFLGVTQDMGADYKYFIFGARLCYHFDTENKNLDTYAGGMLGYSKASASTFGYRLYDYLLTVDAQEGALLYGAQVGIRYYFSRTFGVFGEAGYGVGYITAGLAFRL